MKKILIYLVILIPFFVQAQQDVNSKLQTKLKKTNEKYIKTWRISEQLATADTVPVDTAWINYQDHTPMDTFSIANSYNGNLGSPLQSKIYYKRPTGSDFLFDDAFRPYIYDIKSALFFDTKQPYSNLTYRTKASTFSPREDQVKFTFAASPSKKVSFGTYLDYLFADGEYQDIAAKRFSGGVFGRFNGKHYSGTGLVSVNNHYNHDNGGIKSLEQLYNPLGATPRDLETRFHSYSIFNKLTAFYNHQYTIGFEREVKVNEDSVRMEYVPVTSFGHTLRYEQMKNKYYEPEGLTDKTFYDFTYDTKHKTNDSTALQTLSNVFSVNLAEEFNRWMRFGLTGYVENEVQQFRLFQDSVTTKILKSNTRVGGVLAKTQGTNFRYNILGDIYLIGYKLGEFRLEGKAFGNFKLLNKDVALSAEAYIRNEEPSFFLQNYESNHFKWKNSFSKIYRTSVAGTFSLPLTATRLKVGVENVTNTIYFNEKMLPTQHGGNVQIVYADLKQDFRLKHLTLENNAVYQVTSNADVIPLPMLSLYHNLYFHGTLFKVLKTQAGVSVRYHTKYFAPGYIPALAQFYNQKEMQVGNYPLMNAYLNFHLKQARFFVQYYHLSHMFLSRDFLSMPHYPYAPDMVKLGISWNFYN